MRDMTSETRAHEIIDGIDNGTLDYATVTMEEWLQVSFLSLFHGEEVHIELPIVYGGCAFHLHACVEQVVPGADVPPLRKEI